MARNTKSTRGLGRGLSALMSDVAQDESTSQSPSRPDFSVPIEQVQPNPDQPRRTFDQTALDELTASIAEKGIIQPLIVRKSDGNDSYEIVAGERRWRAAQMAKLHEVPVVVRDYNDTEVLEIAIIENIQRSDLNPVDEAAGYRQLMDRFGHTQEQMASALGKSRSHIANLMRLLLLPDEVRNYLVTGALTAGHARALIGHDQAVQLAREIIQRKLSVRETEKLAKQGPAIKKRSVSGAPVPKDADTVQIENELSASIGMKVTIDHRAGEDGGKLSINYKSLDQLDDLLRALSGH
ncbi:ParB/RepB/Spo0J family partition protein [Yoonia sediminilitoris]|uniref:ParB family chromosome partitioning protein n=1 Tax=Yoonia sediminilitoris TaxID=1286148 RepID=A0A2T6KLW1_9RHOB|nr:ParB/RepB/Spo0J family partition protein [Yoonia sediminilitoris]PUB17174.1 ParB family chromosome partitioning protein [Yoonia sediminilitoris]RCW97469.1 ParB family chromosome partitioning protein [Yoonia sediminilitoris]